MVAGGGIGAQGIPSFHVHAGHAFDGFELVERAGPAPLLLARCGCGEVLDIADARFAPCPDCSGRDTDCRRCGGTGRVIDHAKLEWRVPAQ
ncbi:MAG: hypothetical protein WBP81_24205 [Solirubrobacteraceae bacterium]